MAEPCQKSQLKLSYLFNHFKGGLGWVFPRAMSWGVVWYFYSWSLKCLLWAHLLGTWYTAYGAILKLRKSLKGGPQWWKGHWGGPLKVLPVPPSGSVSRFLFLTMWTVPATHCHCHRPRHSTVLLSCKPKWTFPSLSCDCWVFRPAARTLG